MTDTDHPLIRVMALHALAYCERLFYFEEVEEIRVADANVYAGRRLHEELSEDETLETLEIEDAELGLIGKLDAIRTRDGEIYPYEHKRGRSNHGECWFSDRIQVGAYAMLLERSVQKIIHQARIHYHRDNKTVIVPVDDHLLDEVRRMITRANTLREQSTRPSIVENENLCVSCSLSPVCLPEETRKDRDPSHESIRLFPPKREKQTIHILGHGDRVSRHGDTVQIITKEKETTTLPIEDVGELVLHGYAQISTQAIAECAYRDIPVHWLTSGGNYLCALTSGVGKVQRRLGQYEFLSNPDHRLFLAKTTVKNRIENQIQFLLRLTRGNQSSREKIHRHLRQMKKLKDRIMDCPGIDSLRGLEGACGNTYFSGMRFVLQDAIPEEFQFKKRSRRPPKDRFNAILSFGYSLLYKSVMSAILQVGLEPSLGYYHTPRSSAHPLVLDIMELFRIPIWDQSVIASLKRRQWQKTDDFVITPGKVWLSDNGRKKAIEIFENRLNDEWKHPVLDYSLSYYRQIELEVRLLEKSWTDQSHLFARSRIR